MIVGKHKPGNFHTYQYYCIAYLGALFLNTTSEINIPNQSYLYKKVR